MKVFGYGVKRPDTLVELQDVTICLDSVQAQALGDFVCRCAREMEADPDWEHQHFDNEAPTQIIIFSSAKARNLGDMLEPR